MSEAVPAIPTVLTSEPIKPRAAILLLREPRGNHAHLFTHKEIPSWLI